MIFRPLINSKLEILEKAGLCNDNFSNVEDVTVEDPTQHKIEDYIVKDGLNYIYFFISQFYELFIFIYDFAII